MGCVGCCLRENNSEEQEHQNRRCLPLYRFGQLYFDLCNSLFQRRDRGVVPSDEHATLPLVPTSQVNTGDNNTAVLLSNNDPRGSQHQSQQDGLELGRVKGPGADSDAQGRAPLPSFSRIQVNIVDNSASALSNDDPRGSQPQIQHHDLVLRHAETPAHMQTSVSVRHENVANTQPDQEEKNGSTTCYSGSSQPSPRMTAGETDFYPSSDDEDACPICLEEYTTENPRSTLQCSHQFHLCCIYEWMERSHACPFCSKLMLFKEDV